MIILCLTCDDGDYHNDEANYDANGVFRAPTPPTREETAARLAAQDRADRERQRR